ncbi:glycoside hydrolase family 3 N-terminal domain-containing protein [Proteiniphilum sp. X52]|uniref:glycoside hydrolase family 3 N-terminal domain-containing protein n=1 Tax=Proteiniphilum sp. X52 TaxID=2382159 RepID=UPI000F0A49B6|nr:glycoside hydrolase family 3 N-terminal domain-containing protein [Proteiniphilum sp. X52]RNC64052.1 glycoside hydrolase [Proteiniphilum sp. X52]
MRKKTIFLCISIIYPVLLSAQVPTNLYEQTDKGGMTRWVDSVYTKMTLDEKVGQLFMPIVEPNSGWKDRISGYIRNQKVGGLLFSKGTLAQQADITNYAQQLADIPLLISLDGEWGLSMRLTDAPKYPRNMIIGAIQDEEIVKLYGKEIARQCREMGIHVNFSPSLDVHTNPKNPVIGTRSYGENPLNTAKKGIAYAKGLEENGVMSVAKHFPGHGDTSEDSHKTLPTIPHNRGRLEQIELFPFREYIRAGLSGMMTGHLNVPALQTKGMPASLSPEVGTHLLKKEMGFTGLTFTDGMAMKGVSDQPEASIKALLAGNDIILGVVNQGKEFASVKKAVEEGTIPTSLLEEKVRKILSYKYILGANKFTPINTSTIHNKVNAPSAEWIRRKIYDGAVTLLKNENELIPVRKLDQTKIAAVSIGAPADNTFHKYLKKYAPLTTFNAQSTAALSEIKALKEYDLIIISIHSSNAVDAEALQQLTKNRKTILAFFTSPYRIDHFQASFNNTTATLIGYDAADFAQMSVAQGIFGGIGISGKLPVSTTAIKEGTGLNTKKIRLGYSMPEETGLASERFSEIESIAMEGIRQRAYPGCQILVAKDGVVIYEREFGKFDYGESPDVTDETVYDLASVTKATATLPAIMKLYDEKKIRLQDPLGKFVSQTKGSNKANLTIRSLLLHETGVSAFIPYYAAAIDEKSYSGSLFGKQSAIYHVRYAGAWGRTDYKFLPELISTRESEQFHLPVAKGLYASNEMRDKLLKEVIDTPLSRKGSYRYSCLNFMLLKEAVESVSGTDLDTYVKQNFYHKLGASATFQPLKHIPIERIPATENDPFFRKQHVRGYVHDEGAALFGGISGNAGLFSNANDLAKLYQMWLNGGEYGGERYLSEETVRLFTTTKSSISRRGLGFDKPDPTNSRYSPASPGTPIEVYGHTGFTGTSFWVDPTHNMIYIFLSNRVNPSRSPNRFSTLSIRERIQEELYHALKTIKSPITTD